MMHALLVTVALFVAPPVADRAFIAEDEKEQPVWLEPSGRVPTRTERGKTCVHGNPKILMPTPWSIPVQVFEWVGRIGETRK